MFRSKRFIVAVVLAAVILAGSIGGAVLAADSGDGDQPASRHEAMLGRVSEIYEQNTGVALDLEALKDAFAQAQSEGQTEALQNRLRKLVGEGRMTQEEADEYQNWQGQRPDVSAGFGFMGRGFHGRVGMRGFGGLCASTE
ncbi:MAG: hypothetical protein ABH839_02475 [Chloroflexota bacterium]